MTALTPEEIADHFFSSPTLRAYFLVALKAFSDSEYNRGIEEAAKILSKRLLNHSHRYDGKLCICGKSDFSGTICVIDEVKNLRRPTGAQREI